MIRYVARRLLVSVVVIFMLTLATFLIFRAIPLDPACLKVDCGQRSTVTKAQLKAIDHKLGVDRPILVQYKDFVWRLVRHGSFGNSWRYGTPIDPYLHRALGVTGSILLGGAAVLILLSIPLGIVSALHANTGLDRVILFGSIFGIALHPLVVGYLLRETFGVSLDVLPTGQYCRLSGTPKIEPDLLRYLKATHQPLPCGGVGDWTSHLVLPWLTFSLFFLPIYVRMIRGRVLETLSERHVATARAKGSSEWRVIFRHVLRLSLIPVPSMLAMEIGGALMAAIYIEVVFGMGGIGAVVLQALSPDQSGYDLPVIAAVFFILAAFIVVLNLIADSIQAALDPRVRYGAS